MSRRCLHSCLLIYLLLTMGNNLICCYGFRSNRFFIVEVFVILMTCGVQNQLFVSQFLSNKVFKFSQFRVQVTVAIFTSLTVVNGVRQARVVTIIPNIFRIMISFLIESVRNIMIMLIAAHFTYFHFLLAVFDVAVSLWCGYA